ncbi:hypothetical protein EDD85DRAFT_782812 [Armillaria nabsnona]|nr:hypothetical protein EDD85DRAFT_782812 [Armillaria nabsnona]
MDRRTVERTIIEGGIASQIQLGHEMAVAKRYGDSTTYRSINYNSMHITIRAPSDYSNPHSKLTPKTRLVDVCASVNHTSETQVSEWRAVMTDISLTFQHSPLAQREHLTFCVDNFTRKLRGMLSDHASYVKKTFRLLMEWKQYVIRTGLGFDNILDLDLSELSVILDPAEEQMLEEAGGRVSWTQLSERLTIGNVNLYSEK